MNASWLDKICWNEQGLVPVIVQELGSKDVLMLAWMNADALAQTIALKQAVYWSRSRNQIWHKGLSSGHFQHVHEVRLDCDADALLLTVTQEGSIACHTGRHACFFNKFSGDKIDGNWEEVDPILKDPKEIYK